MSVDGRPYLVKLVRDRIGELLADTTVEYRPIDDREAALKLLRGKLVEEAIEYLLDPSVGELADVQEVIEALAKHDTLDNGTPFGPCRGKLAVNRAQKDKRAERGGFDGLFGMYAQTTAGVS